MTEIILVRHGQANSLATDEESYDRLSDLGHQQARWLGAHMAATNPHFDRVITGTLSRQADTARSMGYKITAQDARLNEMAYFATARAVEAATGLATPQSPQEYAAHLPRLMTQWQDNDLPDAPESFDAFFTRVVNAIEDASALPGRTLMVTSGGVIGMVLRHVLSLDNGGLSNVMLQTMNSSVSRVEYIHDNLMLGTFNATPHLDLPDRAHARTFV